MPNYEYQCQNCMNIVIQNHKMMEAPDFTETCCCGSENYKRVILTVPNIHGIVPKDSRYYGIDKDTGKKLK